MKVLLCSTDNGNHLSQPQHALAYLAAALYEGGHRVEIWDAALHHYPPDDLTCRIDREGYDVVAVTSIAGYWQFRELLNVSKAVNASKHRDGLWFVIGGHGPASDPEYFRRATGADTVWVGEGETDFPDACLHHLECKNVATWMGADCDVDKVPFPAWDYFDVNVYRMQRYPRTRPTDFALPVLSGRGCPFSCGFCFRMVKGYRPRSVDGIVEEIEWLKSDFGITYVNFDDELLTISSKRINEVCEALRPLGIRWMCNARLNVATPDNMRVMASAGCVFANFGIESLDDDVLRRMNKHLTVGQIHRGVQACIDAGISPGLNVIWNNPGDTVDTLNKAVDFLLKYDDGAQCRTIRPMTPYPGSPFWYEAIERGLVRDTAHFYEELHINSDLISVNMMDGITIEDAHQHMFRANMTLLDNYRGRWAAKHEQQLCNLYVENDASFRGFRHG